jgi:hypothetical protein
VLPAGRQAPADADAALAQTTDELHAALGELEAVMVRFGWTATGTW